MRAKDFIKEARTGSLQDDVASALPATYVIPKLKNQDPYLQYRFGVALAAAKGAKDRAEEGDQPFEPKSAWGENEIIISYDPTVDSVIDDALRMVGLTPNDKQLISTPSSEEANDVPKNSPVPAKRKNKYGV